LIRFEFESGIVRLFYLYLCSCGESRLLVSWCAGDKCDMTVNDEGLGKSRRLGVEDWERSGTYRVLDDLTIWRSGDAVCGLHRARGDEQRRFLG
jgi:hypothetical protein